MYLFYQKIFVFLQSKSNLFRFMSIYPEFDNLIRSLEQNGVDVNNATHGFRFFGMDLSYPGVSIHLCMRGTARIIYDMQEITVRKNNLMIVMPGHFLRAIECSDDFTYARTVISTELLNDIQAHLFSHDYDKFNYVPTCQLTDVQADRMRALGKLLAAIAMRDAADLQLRRQMLLSQLALGYEFVNYYRKEQDRQWNENTPATLYTCFCNLVVEHCREHRDVNFYATQLGYKTRYFSKLFLKTSNGISALDWIGQYVCTLAKRTMDASPHQTVKATALQLGFPTTANFCRYFKRVTGIYPQEYKKMKKQE